MSYQCPIVSHVLSLASPPLVCWRPSLRWYLVPDLRRGEPHVGAAAAEAALWVKQITQRPNHAGHAFRCRRSLHRDLH